MATSPSDDHHVIPEILSHDQDDRASDCQSQDAETKIPASLSESNLRSVQFLSAHHELF